MQWLVRLHSCCFTELGHEDAQTRLERTSETSGNVQLVLMDQPFNIRRKKVVPIETTTRLTFDDTYDVAGVLSELWRSGDNFLILCFAFQFPQWVLCPQEKSTIGDRGEEKAVLSVDGHDFIMVKACSHYNRYAQHRYTSFLSRATKDFMQKSVASEENNNTTWSVRVLLTLSSRLPGLPNIIDNAKRLQTSERLLYASTERSAPRQGRVQHSKIDSPGLNICRFSTLGALFPDVFRGSVSTATACMRTLLEKLRVLLALEENERCSVAAENWFVERIFACSSLLWKKENSSSVTRSQLNQ